MRLLLLLLILTFVATTARAAGRLANTADVRQGQWHVQVSAARGVALWYDDVPVSRQSTFYIVKPGWTGLLYDQRASAPQVSVAHTPGGQVITATAQNEDATVGETVTLGADGAATVTLAFGLTHDVPANFEYAAAYLNADLLADAPFSAVTGEGLKTGTIPYATPGTEQAANEFVPSFRQLEVGTRLGQLQLAVSGDCPDFICFDARRDPQGWAREAPIFWTGIYAGTYPLRYDDGRLYHITVRYQITPPPATPAPAPAKVRAAVRVQTVPNARVPQTPPLVIIPQPKNLLATGERLAVTPRTRLVIADDATAQDEQAALSVRHEMQTRFGLAPLPIVRARAVKQAENVIVFGEPRRVPLVGKLLARAGAAVIGKTEGYTLHVGPRWAAVAGHDPAGTFYGAQTLCQLLAADAQGVYIRCAQVNDYPSLAWRGAHLFVGDHALPFHKRLIADVFARFKLNHLVLQCEQARWDTVGQAGPSWAMSKADLRAELAFARAQFIEPVPLVNSVGHMEWLFSDPARLALAEDPQTPYAANVTNPDTYKFLFSLYDEVLDTFHSPVLHIGGDEVTMRGRYPCLSRATYPTVGDAFTAHVAKVHDYLKAKGVGTMVWGDMLLHQTETQDAANAPTVAEARQMRAALPKDIAIADWHYAATGDFSSPQTFRAAGFNAVIASTWFTPGNIAAFSQEQMKNHQFGLLQTTWAGFNSNAQNLADDPKQFTAFVLAADYAWSGRGETPDRLPYNASQVFWAAYAPKPVDTRTRPGFAVDLSALGTRALADTNGRTGWLGYGPAHDLRAVPTGQPRLGGVAYRIAPRILMLRGALSPAASYPTRVMIPLGRKAIALSLLLTTAYAALPKTQVGTLTVTFADRTTSRVPLVYGQNIAAWNDATDAPDAPVVWRGATQTGEAIVLRSLTWTNLSPQKKIASLTLVSLDPTAAPTLLGLTGIVAQEKGMKVGK